MKLYILTALFSVYFLSSCRTIAASIDGYFNEDLIVNTVVNIKVDIQDHVSNSNGYWYSWNDSISDCEPLVHASYDIDSMKLTLSYCSSLGNLVESSILLSNDYCTVTEPAEFEVDYNDSIIFTKIYVDYSFHSCLIYEYDWIDIYCEFEK